MSLAQCHGCSNEYGDLLHAQVVDHGAYMLSQYALPNMILLIGLSSNNVYRAHIRMIHRGEDMHMLCRCIHVLSRRVLVHVYHVVRDAHIYTCTCTCHSSRTVHRPHLKFEQRPKQHARYLDNQVRRCTSHHITSHHMTSHHITSLTCWIVSSHANHLMYALTFSCYLCMLCCVDTRGNT